MNIQEAMTAPQSMAELLDAAKSHAAIGEDQELAARLGKSHSAISNWRSERTAPDDELCFTIADMAHVKPAVVLAIVAAVRARRGRARDEWLRIAQEVFCAVFTAVLLIFGHPGDAVAAPPPPPSPAATAFYSRPFVCYVYLTMATLARMARCIASICHPA